MVAIIHDPATADGTVAAHVRQDETVSFFSIHWEKDASGNEIYPNPDNNCGNGACTLGTDNTCVCSTTVDESAAFDSMPTKEEVLSDLSLGAFQLEMFDINDYELIETGLDGTKAYRKVTSTERTHFPTPAPLSNCDQDYVGWNADFETGTLSGWGCYGCSGTDFLYQPGYGDIGYAGAKNGTGDITHSIDSSDRACLSSGMTLFFTHKVKLVNTTDPTTPIDCGMNGVECPGVRLRIRQGPSETLEWGYLPVMSQWVPGEWNTYAAHFTIPDNWEAPYTMWRVHYTQGDNDGVDITMLIDEASILLSTPTPSSSPSVSSIPSFIPSLMPSIDSESPSLSPSLSVVPSSSPSTSCEGIFPPGNEKILLEKNYDIDISGSSAYKGLVSSYEAGYDGTKAISLALDESFGSTLPAIRTGVNHRNECLKPGTILGISFKAKLLNTTDMSEMSCDPTADDSCPEARLRIRNKDPVTGTVLYNKWRSTPIGFTSWNPVSFFRLVQFLFSSFNKQN